MGYPPAREGFIGSQRVCGGSFRPFRPLNGGFGGSGAVRRGGRTPAGGTEAGPSALPPRPRRPSWPATAVVPSGAVAARRGVSLEPRPLAAPTVAGLPRQLRYLCSLRCAQLRAVAQVLVRAWVLPGRPHSAPSAADRFALPLRQPRRGHARGVGRRRRSPIGRPSTAVHRGRLDRTRGQHLPCGVHHCINAVSKQ
jgi:hypothetical protein